MAFDTQTRNRLARLVAECRDLLTVEFDAKLQEFYGIYANEGRVLAIDKLVHLDDERLHIARLLRERIEHVIATDISGGLKEAVKRVLREQAFTVLNRFAAIRMAEERGIMVESVGGGLNSKGFKMFSEVAFSGLGDAYSRYRAFLRCTFDELSSDLGALFDRSSPYGLLFPRQDVLLDLFKILNASDLKSLWIEDETIGWIYQYYNDPSERKKMRDESSAPRNSRELAVRNQFFTPRYVVEFLTDNTLGRLWYEMTSGVTVLRDRCRYLICRPTEIFLKESEPAPASTAAKGAEENPSQEDLLRAPVHIPHRPLKDPRTIRVLDPACGSMHFGLYAFDLLECIYDEAWEIAHGTDEALKSALSFAPFVSYAARSADKAAFLREVPRLIVEHNLHGIDIDPRATQIAGLSLWLRAHRAWQRTDVKPADRPRITRSNLVCAEPMPGEKELLREFVEGAFPAGERPAFAFLLEKIFDCMTLAGEAGSLLRIEEEIRTAIAEARALAQRQSTPRQAALFAGTERPEQEEFNLRGLTTDEQFWEKAEGRIYEALESYAEQAETVGGFQRRLFADDADQGFAFIDLCRKRYDVVMMNPPFGEAAKGSKEYIASNYSRTKNDVYAAFVERWLGKLVGGGRLGAITSRTGFFLGSFKKWREEVLLRDARPVVLADLGFGVLDAAMVETAAYVLETAVLSGQMLCVRVLADEDKGAALVEAVHAVARGGRTSVVHVVNPKSFEQIPGSPFAYWASESLRDVFKRFPPFEGNGRMVRQGGVTGNDARYLRAWWEVPSEGRVKQDIQWVPFAKGGSYSPFCSDFPVAVRWDYLRGTFFGYTGLLHRPSEKPSSADLYFSEGLTWPLRAPRFAPVPLPSNAVFSIRGYAILAPHEQLLPLLAIGNSSVFDFIFKLALGRFGYPEFVVGILQKLPLPPIPETEQKELARLGQSAWVEKRSLDTVDSIAHPFVVPALLRFLGANLAERANGWSRCLDAAESSVSAIQAKIDAIALRLYDLSETDRTVLAAPEITNDAAESDDDTEPDYADISPASADASELTADLLGYALGCVFGRWDIRYATGERPAPELPDPFAPLPVCPPGMLQDADGLPLSPGAGRQLRAAGQYPLDVAWDGILVDDLEHPLDLERCVHAALHVLWPERTDDLEREACALLGVPGLREWFRQPAGFFADHLRRYSKSRRQAPIYWPLSTASGRYTLWIYYHRLSDQTLFHCINNFVKPKIVEVEADLARAMTAGGDERTKRIRIEQLTTFRSELVDFRDELLRVGQLPYKPNLNDGALITAAPLWRLFNFPKWQKALKECWDELSSGKYDWAHLALTLWPQRVKKSCEGDYSLAIAHGLESSCKTQSPSKKLKASAKTLLVEME